MKNYLLKSSEGTQNLQGGGFAKQNLHELSKKDQVGTKLNSVISRQWTENGSGMTRQWLGKGLAVLRYAATVLLLLCLGVGNVWGTMI